jgi:hypothetical protein
MEKTTKMICLWLIQIMKESKLVQMINTDDDFERIRFKDFNIYKYEPASHRRNLLDNDHIWKPRKNITISQRNGNLNIVVITNQLDEVQNLCIIKNKIKFN